MGAGKLVDILEALVTAHSQLQEVKQSVTSLRQDLRLEIREVGRRVDGFVERVARLEERYELLIKSVKSEIIGELEAKMVASAFEHERLRVEIRRGLLTSCSDPNPESDGSDK